MGSMLYQMVSFASGLWNFIVVVQAQLSILNVQFKSQLKKWSAIYIYICNIMLEDLCEKTAEIAKKVNILNERVFI